MITGNFVLIAQKYTYKIHFKGETLIANTAAGIPIDGHVV